MMSKPQHGTLTFKIVDSNDTILDELPTKNGEQIITIQDEGIYTAKAEYNNFIGDFKLKAYNCN